MSNEQLPIEYAALGYAAGMDHETDGTRVKSGAEWRNQNWDNGLPTYRVPLSALTAEQRDDLLDFVDRHGGAAQSFLFTEVDGQRRTFRARFGSDRARIVARHALHHYWDDLEVICLVGES